MKEKPFAPILSLIFLFGLFLLIALVVLAARAVIDIGGFCAEGGPYEIAQHCPKGSSLVLSVGIPLGFVCFFGYTLALPKTWRPMIFLAWPVLFVALGLVFLQSALFATSSFQIAPFLVGIMMLFLGLVTRLLKLFSSNGEADPYPDRKEGVALQIAAISLGFLTGAALWIFVLG